jgi:hypothetical protein
MGFAAGLSAGASARNARTNRENSQYERGQQQAVQQKELDAERKMALLQDNRVVLHHLKSNSPERAVKLLTERIGLVTQLGGDASDTTALLQQIQGGDIAGATAESQLLDDESVIRGVLAGAVTPSALDQAKTAKLQAETTNLITPSVKPEDMLKINKLKLEIQNQEAVVTERKQQAINNAEQRDQTSMAQAFEANGAIENIDSLLKDDAYLDIYGVGDNIIPTFWSGAVALEAKRDQVVGLLSLESRQKLKGQGTISEGEAKTLAQSATVLSNAGIDEVTAKNELIKVRGIFKRAEQRAMKNPAAKAAMEEDKNQREILSRLPEGSLNNGDGTFTMPSGAIVEPE